jgi:membrane-bound metal-dependent hydrolase YbcI (DUF457 family)
VPTGVPTVMAVGHSLSGILIGVGMAATLSDAPWQVRLLLVPVAGGSALLPDLDHPSAKAARSLGFVTKAIASAINHLSIAVYHATRCDADPADKQNGHRTLTHTAPACVAFGVLAGCVTCVSPIAGAVLLALLIGLLACGLPHLGTSFTLGGAGFAWWTTAHFPSWWWAYSVAVSLGCLSHCLGDALTVSGVPLRWPMVHQGKRWGCVRAPATFKTNSPTEQMVVTPLLGVCVVVAGAFTTGMAQLVIGAVA